MQKEKLSIRAVGIVIHNGQLLVMQRERGKDMYFVFPGGKVEVNETVEEAVVREIMAETSIDVAVDKFIYKHYLDHGEKGKSEQHFYLCKYLKGEPELGNDNEKEVMEKGEKYYKPQWMNLDKISELLLYPLEIRDWMLEDIKNNFINTPREEHLRASDLRQI